MMNTRRVSLLLLPLIAACSSANESGEEAYVLGFAAPLERGFGRGALDAAQLAVDEINQEGGIRGKRLELRPFDDQGEAANSIEAAGKMVRDPSIRAVVGHATSGAMLAAAPIYNDGNLPALGTSATSTQIANAGPWIFRVASSDSANAAAIARQARTLGKRVGILYANDAYGRSLADVFRASLASTDAVIVGDSPYLEDMDDYRPYLRRLAARDAEVVLIAGLEVGASKIIQQMREVGLDATVIGGDGLESLADMEGNYDGTLLGALYHHQSSDQARKFSSAYRARFEREATSPAATAYDAVYILARALGSGATSREEIRRYLEGLGRPGGSPAFEGAAGPVAFDERGDPHAKPVVIVAIDGNGFRLVRSGD